MGAVSRSSSATKTGNHNHSRRKTALELRKPARVCVRKSMATYVLADDGRSARSRKGDYMTISRYLAALRLSAPPVDYDWEWDTLISFRECTDEDKPRLAGALQLISVKAAFALGVACLEWVVARVEGHINTSDALLRIEAAWAAAIDPRYANLPQPPPSQTTPPQEYVRPLSHCHEDALGCVHRLNWRRKGGPFQHPRARNAGGAYRRPSSSV